MRHLQILVIGSGRSWLDQRKPRLLKELGPNVFDDYVVECTPMSVQKMLESRRDDIDVIVVDRAGASAVETILACTYRWNVRPLIVLDDGAVGHTARFAMDHYCVLTPSHLARAMKPLRKALLAYEATLAAKNQRQAA